MKNKNQKPSSSEETVQAKFFYHNRNLRALYRIVRAISNNLEWRRPYIPQTTHFQHFASPLVTM